MKIFRLLKGLLLISIHKTLLLNLKLFPLRELLRFQVLVGRHVSIKNYSNIKIVDSGGKGRIHIGTAPLFNAVKSDRIIINNMGKIIFGRGVIIQPGCVLYTSEHGCIELEGNNRIGTKTQLLSRKKIRIGKNSGISWNCQICDSDFHFIENMDNGTILMNTRGVEIGRNVWIGNHAIISKGVRIADGCIVGQCSFVNKSVNEEHKILVGSPAKCLDGKFSRIWDVRREKELADSQAVNI